MIGIIGALCIFATPFIVLLEAWVVTKVWLWFLAPHFHVQPLPVAAACGLVILVSIARHRNDLDERTKEENSKRAVQSVVMNVFASVFFLTTAAVLHWLF